MSLPGINIRVANVEDAGILTGLSVTTFVETFMADNKPEDMNLYIAEEMNLAALTDELADGRNTFFLAEYGGETVGYAKVRDIKMPEGLDSDKPMELERVYVLKAWHDHKIGAALMTRCMAHAAGHGRDTLWLGVWEHNYRAVKFYQRWGFELFGSHVFQLGSDPQTDVLMKKRL